MTRLFLSIIALIIGLPTLAVNLKESIRFHCSTDTIEIDAMLSKSNSQAPISNLIIDFASEFIGKQYVANTLESQPESLTINIHEFDCVTFVETSIALAITAKRTNSTWRDFAYNLKSIRYRKGVIAGYASRLHYISDWIADNIYRGNITELTQNIDGHTSLIKTINYMSKNSDKYPALNDSLNLVEIKKVEMGYRSHLIPYLKKQTLTKKQNLQQLQDGDIIVILSKTDGLDVSHVALIKLVNDKPHLIHASIKSGKIVLEEIDINEYLKRHARNAPGVRILRVNQ